MYVEPLRNVGGSTELFRQIDRYLGLNDFEPFGNRTVGEGAVFLTEDRCGGGAVVDAAGDAVQISDKRLRRIRVDLEVGTGSICKCGIIICIDEVRIVLIDARFTVEKCKLVQDVIGIIGLTLGASEHLVFLRLERCLPSDNSWPF